MAGNTASPLRGDGRPQKAMARPTRGRENRRLAAGGEGGVVAFGVPPQNLVQGLLGGVVEVAEVHALGLAGGPELAAGEGLERRVGLLEILLGDDVVVACRV